MLFRFRQFPVYKLAKQFRQEIRLLVKNKFPKEERYQLSDQILRAVNSTCLNIAEGSNRSSDKDFAHFLNSSLTSLEEAICCLDLALDNKYIDDNDFEHFVHKGEELGKQLIAFQNKLRT